MDRIVKSSFLFFFAFIICIGVLDLATPFLTVLFSYFALNQFKRFCSVRISIALFIVLFLALSYGFVFLVKEAVNNLPEIATESIPVLINYARKYHFDLPFTDLEGFKALMLDEVRDQIRHLAKFVQIGIKELVFLILGIVITLSLYVSRQIDLNEGKYAIKNNLYTLMGTEISKRFTRFYQSFEMVMGAQLIISAINTFFTGIFVFVIGLPFAKTAIVITFICGLFPIIGNLISNTIIFGVAITRSLHLAVAALIFLVVLHKAEYFLNSKIVGSRIKNPVWLTLLSLLIGEKLMGIPGMILAPVVLHYLKVEGSQFEIVPARNRGAAQTAL